MKTKTVLITSLGVAIVCALVWVSVVKQQAPQAPARSEAVPAAGKPEVVVVPDNPLPKRGKAGTNATLLSVKPDAWKNGAKPSGLSQTDLVFTINGYEVQDPMARLALTFVGSDPDADAYWIGAINDSSLPAEERKDLIEDLNEDGLSDPHHPSAEDMPLIVRRIQLIEQLAPDAVDGVNRDAFAEAHKDLVGLLNGEEPQ